MTYGDAGEEWHTLGVRIAIAPRGMGARKRCMEKEPPKHLVHPVGGSNTLCKKYVKVASGMSEIGFRNER